MEIEIKKLIEERGPLTGSELLEALGGDGLLLWRNCKISSLLCIRTVGTRYLRLDRRINGFARMSPSILREFLTYSVVGIPEDRPSVARRAEEISSHIEGVSRLKSELAYSLVSTLDQGFEDEVDVNERVSVIIAGDIVYNMAHDVPRPERSTGKLVRGSDIDLVVIVDDFFSKRAIERLDEMIYRQKYKILTAPHVREEIDYVVKDLERVMEQVRFDTFRHMVACKILAEGALLYGSEALFHRVKTILREQGVIRSLDDMEEKARNFRKRAEAYLLREDPEKVRKDHLDLFYPTEESEEFE